MVLEKDRRSGKVAVIAHCLINQNAKVNGFAFFPSMIREIVELLHSKDYGILQLPCPETTFIGLRRWWHVREQYDTPGYREHCRRILEPIVNQIEEYMKNGFKVVIIGLDGSPSCGVRCSGTSKEWGGAPKVPEDQLTNYPVTDKPGVFIEEFLNMLRERNLSVPPVIGAGFDMPGFRKEKIIEELTNFLEKE